MNITSYDDMTFSSFQNEIIRRNCLTIDVLFEKDRNKDLFVEIESESICKGDCTLRVFS